MNRRLFLSLLGAAAASAHDLYLMPEGFRFAAPGKQTVWFHLGDSFPESEVAVRTERLVSPRAVGAHGSVPMEGLRAVGKRVAGTVNLNATGTWAVAVETMPNSIDLAAADFESYLKHEGLTHVIEARAKKGDSKKNGVERYTKFVKSLVTVGKPDGFHQKPVGMKIEIVPEADPFAGKPGGTLPVQVLFEGKPAPDLQVLAAWADGGQTKTRVAGRTDASGRVRVPVDAAGVWRLGTILMRPHEGARADWESFWASLTFDIK